MRCLYQYLKIIDLCFRDYDNRYKKFIKGLEALSAIKTNPVIIKNTDCLEIKNDLIDKIDLIFLDPPYDIKDFLYGKNQHKFSLLNMAIENLNSDISWMRDPCLVNDFTYIEDLS